MHIEKRKQTESWPEKITLGLFHISLFVFCAFVTAVSIGLVSAKASDLELYDSGPASYTVVFDDENSDADPGSDDGFVSSDNDPASVDAAAADSAEIPAELPSSSFCFLNGETVYVRDKTLPLLQMQDDQATTSVSLRFGTVLTCEECFESGYTYVRYDGKESYEGYVKTSSLSGSEILHKVSDYVTLAEDCDVYDYPSRRDGDVTGELLEKDHVARVATFDDVWSRVVYEGVDGGIHEGYILTSHLIGYENIGKDTAQAAGVLHEGSGQGIFVDAVNNIGAPSVSSSTIGVLIGTPQSVPETVTLKPLGVFRCTHYCPCSICCGPYADGITAIGTTAITNHTIAVSPSQIPYGSLVAINGQVYVAEDCGGAIRTNCIDIYVATHEEALAKGVFYTEVYLIQ